MGQAGAGLGAIHSIYLFIVKLMECEWQKSGYNGAAGRTKSCRPTENNKLGVTVILSCCGIVVI